MALSHLLVCALLVSSSLARVTDYNDQSAFEAALGASTNYVFDIFTTAHGHLPAYTESGHGYKGIYTSRDVLTHVVDSLAPVRDGYGTHSVPELVLQSTVAQTSELFLDFSTSPNPVFAFGASIFLGDSGAFATAGSIKININHGRKVYMWTSVANADIPDQFFGITTGFPIVNIEFSPIVSDPDSYVSLTRGYIGTTPIVYSDPHFIGFQGERYEFQGEPNKWFSIISDERLQVNSRFEHLTYTNEGNTNMVAFGILAEGNTILISANSTDAIVNGNSVRRVSEPSNGVKVTVVNEKKESYVEVDTPFYTMTIEHKQTHENQPFLNFIPLAKDTSRAPHGVLGQTMQHHHNQKVHIGNEEGVGEIEGTFKDYEVSSAFATDSKFNRYQ